MMLAAAILASAAAGYAWTDGLDGEIVKAPLVRVSPTELPVAALLGGSTVCQTSYTIGANSRPEHVRAECASEIDEARIRADLLSQARALVAEEAERETINAISRWFYDVVPSEAVCVRATHRYLRGATSPEIVDEPNDLPCGRLDIDL